MQSTPKLGGYRKEEVKDRHWDHQRVESSLRAAVDSSLDLGGIDLREWSSPRHDQKHLGSCVAQATVKALEIKRNIRKGVASHIDLSVLAVYYLARELMNPRETHLDKGTYISHAFDAIRRFGVCEEALWPYDTEKFDCAPSWSAMRRAHLHKIESFYRITSHGKQRVEDVLLHLHAKNPVVFGTAVTASFYDTTAETVVGPVNGAVKGGHAMCIVGWLPDHLGGVFVVENSWGQGFADNGFFYASPEYVGDPWAFDFWACADAFDPWSKA